jgi:hypothetical protein
VKPKFRAVFRGALYACFAVMNQALLVREKNRVFIDDELWLRIKEDLDRTVRGPDVLLRFASANLCIGASRRSRQVWSLGGTLRSASADVGHDAGGGGSARVE